MAYSMGDRFSPTPKYFALLDPGTYQLERVYTMKTNKAPFLTKAVRNTSPGMKVWTRALYDGHITYKIPNCTSLMSKRPRFPYEAFSEEDLEEILCKCGFEAPCVCPTGKQEQDFICQGKVRRRIFKGPPPRAVSSDEGLSAPSKTDRGFDILPDGSKRRLRKEILDESQPFYNARVNESTAFYQGWKWSKWSSQRSQRSLDVGPGPADYTIEKQPTDADICQEKVREHKRKISKQPRFIEIIQERNIAEGRPGPASYSPTSPKGTGLQFLGAKAERFPQSQYYIRPGPTDYHLRRDFDPVEIPEKPCQAKLPEPPCFSNKDLRFKPQREEGPSPASYYAVFNPQFLHCSKAPFGSSSVRFKDKLIDSDEENFDKCQEEKLDKDNKPCPSHTWEFRSKTVRMKSLKKKYDEPSPADLPQNQNIVQRPPRLQYIAPFSSSEGRFQPWYNWIPVLGQEKTPGPCYYDIATPRCLPAVNFGPLSRAPRFPSSTFGTPAPNEYNVGGGVEIILRTHNQRLLDNLKNQHKFHWKPKEDTQVLSCEQKETILLQKSIKLLEIDDMRESKSSKASSYSSVSQLNKPKLLRCFVYSKKIPQFF